MFNQRDSQRNFDGSRHISPARPTPYPYPPRSASPPRPARPVAPPPPHPIHRPPHRPVTTTVPPHIHSTSPPLLRPPVPFTDYGPNPFVVNIEQATLANDMYRQTLWTGPHMQSTLMCIPVGEDIGLEVHPDNDQFLRLEQGQGVVQMGNAKNNLTYKQTVFANSAVFVPAGTWHNITNVGSEPMKLYVIYAPPHHPHGTVHATKAIAEKMGD